MKRRRNFSSSFKTKVVLEALTERVTMTELAQKYKLHINQISKWKQEFLDSADSVFASSKPKPQSPDKEIEKLYKIIGQQKVEIDFLKQALS